MSLFFKNRDGQTPIDPSIIHDLKHSHIQDMSELYEQERENIAEGIIWLNKKNHDIYDYFFWLNVHKFMYCNVWKFAGQIRKVELNNTDFKMPYDVRPSLLELSRDLANWVDFKTYPEKEMAALFHEKLLTIHPFKDGNGRWARVLTEFVCKILSIEIPSWGKNIQDDELRRTNYIKAVTLARHEGQYNDLVNIMFHFEK